MRVSGRGRFLGAWVGLLLGVAPRIARAQAWIESGGPGAGDSGSRTAAIALREILNPEVSMARTPYNHPSDMAECNDGTLIWAWNGGPDEGEAENKVWVSRKPLGGAWSQPVPGEPNTEKKSLDFGVLYQPRRPGSPLLMFYMWDNRPGGQWKGAIRTSSDCGLTWSERILAPTSVDAFWKYQGGRLLGPLMNHPVELPDGTLLGATSKEIDEATGRWSADAWASAIVRIPADNLTGSQPGGSPWQPTYIGPRSGIQGAFLVLSPDYANLLLAVRTGVHGGHATYRSSDAGRTWTSMPVAMSDNAGGAGVGAVSLDVESGPRRGWHVVAGSIGGPARNGLTVAVSSDPLRPQSWTQVLVLDKGLNNEDADPSFFQSRRDRKLHLYFTGRGTRPDQGGPSPSRLKHYVIDPDRLVDPTAPPPPPPPVGSADGSAGPTGDAGSVPRNDAAVAGGAGGSSSAGGAGASATRDGATAMNPPGSAGGSTPPGGGASGGAPGAAGAPATRGASGSSGFAGNGGASSGDSDGGQRGPIRDAAGCSCSLSERPQSALNALALAMAAAALRLARRRSRRPGST